MTKIIKKIMSILLLVTAINCWGMDFGMGISMRGPKGRKPGRRKVFDDKDTVADMLIRVRRYSDVFNNGTPEDFDKIIDEEFRLADVTGEILLERFQLFAQTYKNYVQMQDDLTQEGKKRKYSNFVICIAARSQRFEIVKFVVQGKIESIKKGLSTVDKEKKIQKFLIQKFLDDFLLRAALSQGGKYKIAKWLIDQGADPKNITWNFVSEVETLKLFIENGVSISKKSFFISAIEKNAFKMMEFLVEKEHVRLKFGLSTVMQGGAIKGVDWTVSRLESLMKLGLKPLHVLEAVLLHDKFFNEWKQLKVIIELVKRGYFHPTMALTYTLFYGKKDIIESIAFKLIEQGANVGEALDRIRPKSRDKMIKKYDSDWGLVFAVYYKKFELAKKLVKEADFDNALGLAAKFNLDQVANFLIKKGARINKFNLGPFLSMVLKSGVRRIERCGLKDIKYSGLHYLWKLVKTKAISAEMLISELKKQIKNKTVTKEILNGGFLDFLKIVLKEINTTVANKARVLIEDELERIKFAKEIQEEAPETIEVSTQGTQPIKVSKVFLSLGGE